MWVILEGKSGSKVGLASNPSMVLSLNSISEHEKSKNNFIVLSNGRASEWNALSNNGNFYV